MGSRLRRALLIGPLVTGGASGVAFATGHELASPASCAAAATSHHAALVIEHGDGSVLRVCVGFNSATLTGEQILQASHVEYATVDYGALGKALCRVDMEPASYPPTCWSTTSPYWATFISHTDGTWAVAARGISNQTYGDGDAEGVRYDPQSGAPAPPPPAAGTCTITSSTPTPSTPPPSGATSGLSQSPTTSAPHRVAAATSPSPDTTETAPPTPGVVVDTTPTPVIHRSVSRVHKTAATDVAPAGVGLPAAAAGAVLLLGFLAVQIARRRR